MPQNLLVKNCRDVSTCDQNSWDQLFCICDPTDITDGICTAPIVDTDFHAAFPSYDPAAVDAIPSLQGVYSTLAEVVSTLPSTGQDSASWQDTSNAIERSEERRVGKRVDLGG